VERTSRSSEPVDVEETDAEEMLSVVSLRLSAEFYRVRIANENNSADEPFVRKNAPR
jgi:hypothetical protein